MWRYLNNILILVLLSGAVHAQVKDSTKQRPNFFPTGIRIGADIIGPIRTQIEEEGFSGYEFNADIDFHRYYLAVDVGRWERNFSTDADDYANEGSYMRIGVDVNFLKKDP